MIAMIKRIWHSTTKVSSIVIILSCFFSIETEGLRGPPHFFLREVRGSIGVNIVRVFPVFPRGEERGEVIAILHGVIDVADTLVGIGAIVLVPTVHRAEGHIAIVGAVLDVAHFVRSFRLVRSYYSIWGGVCQEVLFVIGNFNATDSHQDECGKDCPQPCVIERAPQETHSQQDSAESGTHFAEHCHPSFLHPYCITQRVVSQA